MPIKFDFVTKRGELAKTRVPVKFIPRMTFLLPAYASSRRQSSSHFAHAHASLSNPSIVCHWAERGPSSRPFRHPGPRSMSTTTLATTLPTTYVQHPQNGGSVCDLRPLFPLLSMNLPIFLWQWLSSCSHVAAWGHSVGLTSGVLVLSREIYAPSPRTLRLVCRAPRIHRTRETTTRQHRNPSQAASCACSADRTPATPPR